MKDVPFIIAIVGFWLFLSFFLFFLAQDDTIVTPEFSGNDSTLLGDINTTMSSDDTGISVLSVQSTGFWSMLIKIFTFRIPSVIAIPFGVGLILSFLNYMLVLAFGLLLYRQLRSGSG